MTIDTHAVPAAPLSLAERARTGAESRTGTNDPVWAATRWTARAQRMAARL